MEIENPGINDQVSFLLWFKYAKKKTKKLTVYKKLMFFCTVKRNT